MITIDNTGRLGGLVTVVALAALPACNAPQSNVQADAWVRQFTPPRTMDTERMHLEPLTPAHAELDYEAFMSSRQHLRQTLHWGSWPSDDATVEDNRKDLERHLKEFRAREAYAYTVLTPDRSKCLGCVYLNPVEGQSRSMKLSLWVIEPEVRSDLDQHLLGSVLDWIRQKWPIDEVIVSLHVDNRRGIEVAESLRLSRGTPPDEDHVTFVWRRG